MGRDDRITVADAPARDRYEATADGRLAGGLTYRERPGGRALVHTEVAAGFESRGVGGLLARSALDDRRAGGLEAVPLCPFIAAWIARHPEYEDLVPPSGRRFLPGRPPP